jgi:hypothetical protein
MRVYKFETKKRKKEKENNKTWIGLAVRGLGSMYEVLGLILIDSIIKIKIKNQTKKKEGIDTSGVKQISSFRE